MDVQKADLTSLDRGQLLKVALALVARCDQLDKEVKRLARKLENAPSVPSGNPNLQLPKEERPLANMGRPPLKEEDPEYDSFVDLPSEDELAQEESSHGPSNEDQEAEAESKPSAHEHSNPRGAKHRQRG